ncbi:MAG: hypothetical protein CEE38_10645 [Planctomycetes bacterium B3_Pla]|nr:MAG: hypothetical protein CEE38_10645 [Planctomycetes bacterium B3_Pla]
MKPIENIEEFVSSGKPDVITGPQMDKRILDDSFAAMDETIAAKRTSAAGTILRSRAMRFAAVAAVIVVVTGVFLGPDTQAPNEPAAEPRLLAQSPEKMMSMISLRMAYQQGGFDALDRQFRDTLNVLGPRSSSVSKQELLQDFNGS